jgi:hypothetical protein
MQYNFLSETRLWPPSHGSITTIRERDREFMWLKNENFYTKKKQENYEDGCLLGCSAVLCGEE